MGSRSQPRQKEGVRQAGSEMNGFVLSGQNISTLQEKNLTDDKFDSKFNRQGTLAKPKPIDHGEKEYKCDACIYESTTPGNLTKHMETKHEGVIYRCIQCDYKVTTKNSLTTHKQSHHEGVRYFCDTCNYFSTTQHQLRQHKRAIHEGLRYSCDECDYTAIQKALLNTHKQSKHELCLVVTCVCINQLQRATLIYTSRPSMKA
jgi:KRAB domain-containing zinc finger protein